MISVLCLLNFLNILDVKMFYWVVVVVCSGLFWKFLMGVSTIRYNKTKCVSDAVQSIRADTTKGIAP